LRDFFPLGGSQIVQQQAEASLAALVVSKTIFARIDRPANIITFQPPKNPSAVLQEWSSNVKYACSIFIGEVNLFFSLYLHSRLMHLVDKTSHLIVKERMVHNM
jgi:26S proteasome regulatory subunit N5